MLSKIDRKYKIIGLTVVSGVFGLLLLVASGVLIAELRDYLDLCADYYGNYFLSDCDVIYGDVGAAGLGLVSGVIQLILLLIVVLKRGNVSAYSNLATHISCLIISLLAFSVAMFYHNDRLKDVWALMISEWKSKLTFFYVMSAINWIYALIAIILVKLLPRPPVPQPAPVVIVPGQYPQVYAQYPPQNQQYPPQSAVYVQPPQYHPPPQHQNQNVH